MRNFPNALGACLVAFALLACHSQPPAGCADCEWECPFPTNEEARKVTLTHVTIEIDVDDTGKLVDVKAVEDPGRGFGEAAIACARSQEYLPHLDDAGHPVRWKRSLRIRYDRR